LFGDGTVVLQFGRAQEIQANLSNAARKRSEREDKGRRSINLLEDSAATARTEAAGLKSREGLLHVLGYPVSQGKEMQVHMEPFSSLQRPAV
jgi:hypothetical protein